MKKLFFLTLVFFQAYYCVAQRDTVITIQPGPSDGQDVPLFEHSPNANPDLSPEFITYHWNFGSSGTSKGVSLIRFELPVLSSEFELSSAHLSLFHNGTSGSAGQIGDNASYLKKVTSDWDVEKVTWNTLPSTTINEQIFLKKSTSTTENYENIDVTAFVEDWLAAPTKNYGMMMDIIDNTSGRSSMKFCSSNYTSPEKRPKLVLTYSKKVTADSCIVIQPGADIGKDVLLNERTPTKGLPNTGEFISYNWTFSGTYYRGHSLLQFDLPQLGGNYELTDARLSLYHNGTSSSEGQAGNNASYLKKVTSQWTEADASWNNMPSTTDEDRVLLKTSSSSSQDYENIDITAMAKDWYNNPKTNFGMMLELIQQGNNSNSMKFCSSDYEDSTHRPKLELCFSLVSGKEAVPQTKELEIYPNPNSGHFNVVLPDVANNTSVTVNIYTAHGILVHQGSHNVNQTGTLSIHRPELPSGCYIVQVLSKEFTRTQNIVLEH